MAKVSFTPNLRRHVDASTREIPGSSVADALDHLFRTAPMLRNYVVDDQGNIRKHVKIFVDNQVINDLNAPLTDASEVLSCKRFREAEDPSTAKLWSTGQAMVVRRLKVYTADCHRLMPMTWCIGMRLKCRKMRPCWRWDRRPAICGSARISVTTGRR